MRSTIAAHAGADGRRVDRRANRLPVEVVDLHDLRGIGAADVGRSWLDGGLRVSARSAGRRQAQPPMQLRRASGLGHAAPTRRARARRYVRLVRATSAWPQSPDGSGSLARRHRLGVLRVRRSGHQTPATVSGSLTMPLAWRPTAIRSPCAAARGAVSAAPLTQGLVGRARQQATPPIARRRGARARTGGRPRTRRPARTAAAEPCRAPCARRSAARGRPGRSELDPVGQRSARARGRAERAGGARRVPADRARGRAPSGGGRRLAPRPLSTARSSAAVGRAAGSGERQRCRRAHLGVARRRRHQPGQRRRLGRVGLHELRVLGLVVAPVGMLAGEQLVEDQPAGEDVRGEARHGAARHVLGRAVVVGADVALDSRATAPGGRRAARSPCRSA